MAVVYAFLADGLEEVECLATADVLVLLVDHKAFKATSGDAVRQKYVVDTKGR